MPENPLLQKPEHNIVRLIQDWQHQLLVPIYSRRSKNKCFFKKSKANGEKILSKRYYLGDKYPGVYLTEQEARCMFYFMQGLTNREVSAIMGISHRTVADYSDNIRRKVPCNSKAELVNVVNQTDFTKLFDH